MANDEHLDLLRQGTAVWNEWRERNPDIDPDLIGANLSGAKLSGVDLREANLSEASFFETIFNEVDLTRAKGLNECLHDGPSLIDFRTLSLSKNVPISFLRGCGLPDNLIDYLPSLRGDAIEFYSCFISYSSKGHVFADRLHADLQNKGVRCWFAPHDKRISALTSSEFNNAKSECHKHH